MINVLVSITDIARIYEPAYIPLKGLPPKVAADEFVGFRDTKMAGRRRVVM